MAGGGSPAFAHQSSQDLLSDEEEEERAEAASAGGMDMDEYANGRHAGLSKEEQDRLRLVFFKFSTFQHKIIIIAQ